MFRILSNASTRQLRLPQLMVLALSTYATETVHLHMKIEHVIGAHSFYFKLIHFLGR